MKSFFTTVIVKMVLEFLEKRTRKGDKKSEITEEKFLIKLSFGYFWLGLVGAALGVGLMIGLKLEDDLPMGLAVICMLVASPGFMVMIGTMPGVWELLVDQGNITVTKCFIFKKHFQFSEITHCKTTRGGWKVYVKDRKRKAFFVDRLMSRAGLFMERIEAANIPIEEMVRGK